MGLRIHPRMTRAAYDKADEQARSIETRLAQLHAEWEARKRIYDEDIRRLEHDQRSLRGALIAILDELDRNDPKPPAKS